MAKIFALLLLVLSSQAASAEEAARCYRLAMESPEMRAGARPRMETWCYEKPPGLAGSLYIYNADQEKVRFELALLVSSDGIITHASLAADKLTVHKVSAAEFNPFSVPLREPGLREEGVESVPPVTVEGAREVLDKLRSAEVKISSLAVSEAGTMASAAFQPWRGYWWPYKTRPLQRGPYLRFDQLVTQRTGANPGAVAWEDTYHRYKGVWWEGHCNGWAAASVLRSEPKFARIDAASGLVFSVSDQKALYTGVDYCVNSAFFGKRNRGQRDDNPKDIEPALFHKTFSYYIGSLRKPVAMDYRSDTAVDNHVVSAYRFDMVPNGPNSYNVTATLSVHKYDGKIIDEPGIAPLYTRVYKYVLTTDANGVPSGGYWLSANPDFIWVPLSPRACTTNNQNLNREWVDVIMTLPSQ